MKKSNQIATATESSQTPEGKPLAEAAGSTLTSQGKRYGFTTAGALAHLGEMLSHGEDWDTLTNYDRACIREVATCAERHLSNIN